MLYRSLLFATALAGVLSTNIALADQTTTTTTTVVKSTVTCPTGRCLVVSPTTGRTLGLYDPTTRLLTGQLLPGSYVIEKDTGRIIGTLGPNGELVSYSVVAPAIVPQHFQMIDNRLVYLAPDFAFRRAQLQERVDEEYTAGRLSTWQARELEDQLAEIAGLELKCADDGSYSSSMANKIDRRLANVQDRLDNDIAYSTTVNRVKIIY